MNPALKTFAYPLADALRCAGYTVAGLSEFLGQQYWSALRRGEPGAVAFALRANDQDALAVLVRVFLLHDPVERNRLESVLGAKLCSALLECDVLGLAAAPAAVAGEWVQALIDIQPHVINDTEQLVFSDVDASMVHNHVPGHDHVLGVGAASISLLKATPTSAVDSVLDLGTGSGVQALSQAQRAKRVVATDVHVRALEFAAATFSAAQVAVEVLEGSWFEPVVNRRFDRIVANPPFVVGRPEVSHVYRDSGLNLDGATRKVASESAMYLTLGGTAHLLGSWVHEAGSSWQARIASWFPDTGVSVWVLQRDVVDPAHYVSTWLKDESIDPRSPQGRQKTEAWLQHFHDMGVQAIGFGFIAIQRIADDTASEIVIEQLPAEIDAAFGAEVEEYFLRLAWLRARSPVELLQSRFLLRPGVAKEEVSVADVANQVGFSPVVCRLTRTDKPQWSHDVDTHVGSLVGGLHPAGLSLAETVEFYALAHDLDSDELKREFVPIVSDLIRHGLVLPAELITTGCADL